MDEAEHLSLAEHTRGLLSRWEQDPELIGAYILCILCPQTYEIEIRKTGSVPEFSPEEIKNVLAQAQRSHLQEWNDNDQSLYRFLWNQDQLLALCRLFPAGSPTWHET